MKNRVRVLLVLTGLVAAALGITSQAQIVSQHGQNVVPVYEGWWKNPDGSYTMFFGYFNRNFEERINIPVGPDNGFDPPAADRGQPTHFYPRRQQFVFTVKVPGDWGEKDLVWTLTSHGKTEKTHGTLKDFYEIDNQLIAKNMGAGSFGIMLANKDEAPTVTVQPAMTAVTLLPDPFVVLTAVVKDDGVPPPAPTATTGGARGGDGVFLNVPVKTEPRRPRGLSVQWIQYRGPGEVTFSPDGFLPVTNGGRVSTTAHFSQPGTYTLRAIASDSLLFGTADATVTVAAR